jgi:hypothetical protein
VKKKEIKFLTASIESLPYCENLSSNPLLEASIFLVEACDSKNCMKTACDPKIVSKASHEFTQEKIDQ